MLARRARGRVLDLGGAASHEALWDSHPEVTEVVRVDASDRPLEDLVRDGAPFDAVFSVFQLASAGDLGGLLAMVDDLVDDDGVLLFLEPGRLTGPAGRAQRAVASGVARATGWRPDVDIPQSLRRAGLSVTDVERHRPGTVQWWISSLVEGRAHRSLLHR